MFVNAENRTRSSWVRSASATSVLCRHPKKNISIFCCRKVQRVRPHPVRPQIFLHPGSPRPRRTGSPRRSRHRLRLAQTGSEASLEPGQANLASLEVSVRRPAGGGLQGHGRVPSPLLQSGQPAVLSGKHQMQRVNVAVTHGTLHYR